MDLFLLGCILVIAHATGTILGFGTTLIALALGVYLMPLETLVPILVLLVLPQNLWMVARWGRHIEWRVLLRHILPAVGIGIPIGIWAQGLADEAHLRMILGVFIVVISLTEIVLLCRRGAAENELQWYFRIPVLVVGGIFHGLFATGGPLIVYYANRQFKTHAVILGTLPTVWLILSAVLLTNFWVRGQIDSWTLRTTALVFPGLIAGILLGSFIHVREPVFRGMTYALLFVSGLLLLVK